MHFIDLFCGTGAFSYVLEKNGHKCVFANDFIQESKEIYELNNKQTVFVKEDLNKVKTKSIPKHSILCGGWPCQPFSIAGKQEGFNDSRANVFWKIIEILKYHKPSIIILENVKNLTSHDKKNTFKVVKKELETLGYNLKYKILDTSIVTNVPQHRERIYIVGFLEKKYYDSFEFPQETNTLLPVTDLLEQNVEEKYYYSERLKVYEEIKKNVTKHVSTNTVYQYRRYYTRENKSSVCPTLTANMGGGGHNVPLILDDKGIRKLTPRECFNLQGFPESYQLPPNLSDSKLYKLAGNAVSIPVIEKIIKEITILCLENQVSNMTTK